MNRILLTLTVVIASAMGLGGPMANAASEKGDACAIQCKDCERTCLACVDACLDELAGKADRKKCIKLCLDCADICGACSKIAARGGPLEATISAACAEACEKCAAECEKHKEDKACQACAEQCKKCAKECKEQGKK
ncbi:MAG: four-helix bundle copper-binding protein [Planctomycetaceae bacterium]